MAKSVLSSDTLPKAGRVNEVCREWLVHEDGALAYRLQDEEIKEHYTGNKVRNAQVREDLPRARVEQELETLKYQSLVQQQEERDAYVARQIALTLEQEERQKEKDILEQMRLQLRLDDEDIQLGLERRIQLEKDEELAKKLQEEEESIDNLDSIVDERLLLDQKIAMEAQDAELARMLQSKERIKARKARERARQRRLERQQHLQQMEDQTLLEKPQRPDKLDLKSTTPPKNRLQQAATYPQYSGFDEIQSLEEPAEEIREVPNVAAIIDPTYNAHRNSSIASSSGVSSTYGLTTPPQDTISENVPCYMPIQGQRRNQIQALPQNHEEKHKRKVKDGCKQQ